MYNTEQRARELMLAPQESRRYIEIYKSNGICPDCKSSVGLFESDVCTHARTCVNGSPFGFVVMVRDRGQDEPRMLNKIYPDHVAATTVKHNLTINAGPLRRVNSAWVREATAEDVAKVEE